MAILPQRARLKFKGNARSAMRKADRYLKALLRLNEKREYMTSGQATQIAGITIVIQSWLVEKTVL